MISKQRLFAFTVLLMVILVLFIAPVSAGELKEGTLEHGGHVRTYEYFIPSGYDGTQAVPLVLSFHGLGSDGKAQIGLSRFNLVAEDNGFIAVFPDSTALEGEHPNLPPLPNANRQWNIGVDMSLQYAAGVDDVGFVVALIDKLAEIYNIDLSRVYATGMSNGAMFAYRLALEIPDRIAGIAAVTSPMTVNFAAMEATRPVSVIIMVGDEDPIVPFEGGGIFMSTADTVAYWVAANGITTAPEITYLPQTAANDPTRIRREYYSGGLNNTAVILYVVEGGGHTWPGGPQYFPPEFIGLVSRHLNGSAAIWEHFQELAPVVEQPVTVWLYYLIGGLPIAIVVLVVTLSVRKRAPKKASV